MKISERKLRRLVVESIILNEWGKVTLNVSNDGRMFSSKKGQYIHKPTAYDPVIRKIAKIIDKKKDKYITPMLDYLKKVYIKDASGDKRRLIDNKNNPFFKAIIGNYVSFASEYSKKGNIEDALFSAELTAIPDIPKDAKKGEQKALVRKDPNDRMKGYEIKTIGQDKSSDVITFDFKNASIDGESVSGAVSLTDLFRDVLAGDKLLKFGSGRAYINNKNTKDSKVQMEWMQVKALQGLLISAGYAKGLFSTPDGDYGGKTKKAVENMQRALNLEVDGKVGQQTASALNPKVTGSKVPITGKGDIPKEAAKKLGL